MSKHNLPTGWKYVPLKQIVDFENGKAHEDCAKESGKYKLVNSRFVSTAGEIVKYSDEIRCPLEVGDLAMVMSDVPNGKALASCYLIRKNDAYTLNQRICRLRPKKVVGEFLFYFLNRNPHYLKLDNGVSQTNLRKEEVLSCPIIYPPLPEQKAIADLLSTWDDAIEKTERLIQAKEKRFAWLLRELISQPRNTQKDTKWERVKLGEVFNIKTYSSKSKYIEKNGRKFIIDMGSVTRDFRLIPSKQTNLNIDLLNVGDLVMPKDDIGGGNIIGRVAVIKKPDTYVCGDHVYRLMQRQNHNIDFLYFLINSQSINRQLRAKSNGTSQLGLGIRDLQQQNLLVPKLDVQQRIADALSSAQHEIDLLKQLAEKYKTQKRGLMQKMLTGEWRVKSDITVRYE